ncbi:hypothetical protein QE152_g6473 [Popillia japonica]|uniref:Uncharacterized protein n=1 Tax=Popillia japonica TaxID=7064 RepID=A0AAW1MIW2_POPJA
MEEVVEGINDIKICMKEIKENQKEFQDEVLTLKRENMQLKKRVQELENKLTRIEKEHKKENIVIKGLDPKENINKIDVQEFIEDKMGIKVEIKEVERIGINKSKMIIKAKMNNMDNKIHKRRRKNTEKVKGSGKS